MLDFHGTQGLYIFYSYESIFISSQVPASRNADLKKTTLMKAAQSKQATWLCCLHKQRDLCWGELALIDTNEKLEESQEIKCHKAEAAIEPQINTNLESFLSVFLFVFINCFVPRDYWQITFVMLKIFCLLRKTSHLLFLMDNIKLDGIPSKIK